MYVSHYDLSGQPFQLSADPRFYFESATHRKAMSYLGYGLAQGEGFIVITGDEGSGKSTLVAQLVATIDPQRLTAVKIICGDMDGESLLRHIAHALGIATEGVEKRHVLSRIEAYMHHQARAGRRSLLIVDEAQSLTLDSLDALRQLSNFQLGGQSLAQIFLFGRSEFRDLVRNAPELEALRQRIIASHHLEPLQAEEVRPYLEHRLKVVGWTGRPALTAQAVASLCKASGGMLSRLNIAVCRTLECAATAQSDRIDVDLVAQACTQLGTLLQFDAALAAEAEAPAEPVIHAGAVRNLAEPADRNDLQDTHAKVHALRTAISQTASEVQGARSATLASADAQALAEQLMRIEARLAAQDDMLRELSARLLESMGGGAAGGSASPRAA